MHMYTLEQKQLAMKTFIRLGHDHAATVAELGYPTRASLYNWWRDFTRPGGLYGPSIDGDYEDEQKLDAVAYYLENGRGLKKTLEAMGYPRTTEALAGWIDELAPGERKRNKPGPAEPVPAEAKARAVAELEAGAASAGEVAARCGVSRTAPYAWREKILGDNGMDGEEVPMDAKADGLPDDPGALKEMLLQERKRLRAARLELEVREMEIEILKKGAGTGPKRLTNAEKARIVGRLRDRYGLHEILPVVGMAKSSYEYAAAALARPRRDSPSRDEARRAVVSAFRDGGGAYGYRRVLASVNAGAPPERRVGEWTVRAIMREEGLSGAVPKRRRRYSSYAGEISEAPANLLLGDDGTHRFTAGGPNEIWVTDVTEFRIPAGKAYLSPVLDCMDGMPLGWSIGRSPNAELANSSLAQACSHLRAGDHPVVHSDRGCQYRWPGWADICREHGLVRSMSRKGRSEDNARAEGFFGRLKVEFFHGRDWSGVTIERFIELLDGYMVWYRDKRMKSSLGNRSPMQYRRELGLTV